VVKLGGSVLTGPRDGPAIRGILSEYEGPLVVVVSALKGVTDELVEAAGGPARRDEDLLERLRERHRGMAAALGAPPGREGDGTRAGAAASAESAAIAASAAARARARSRAVEAAAARIDEILARLGELLACPASRRDRRSRILASGERLSAVCVAVAAAAIGRPGPVIEPGRLGLVARGIEDDAEADIPASARAIRSAVDRLELAVVPGFYGVSEDGRPLLFGRGGSDYSAAVIAACLGARSCDLVKDVSGIFTADPARDPGARRISELSYREAAAMAAAGSKVLHPRCVAPLAAARVVLRVRGASLADGMTSVGPRPAPRDAGEAQRAAQREAPGALAAAERIA
jgi:aspartate kinase/aspartokinase/homoserine dehydrogenase 1